MRPNPRYVSAALELRGAVFVEPPLVGTAVGRRAIQTPFTMRLELSGPSLESWNGKRQSFPG